MIAIVVATPLQLFNSMIIMRHHYSNEKCDLVVLTFACEMQEKVDNYKSFGIIRNTYFMRKAPDYRTKLGKIWNLLFPNKEQKTVLKGLSGSNYKILLTTVVGETSSWLYTKMVKANPQIMLGFYEEGLGVYTSGIVTTLKTNKILYRLLGYKDYGAHLKMLYMYRPDICLNINNFLQRIPIGVVTEKDKSFLTTCFNNLSIKAYTCKAIYFDGHFSHYKAYKYFDENVLIDRLESIFKNGELVIRAHPRSCTEQYKKKGYIVDENKMAWEEIVFSNYLPKDILYITVFSSVFYTAKFIFDIEPSILVLGKMIRNEYKREPWSANFWPESLQFLMNELKSIYRDSSKIMIPESFEEMDKMLTGYLS